MANAPKELVYYKGALYMEIPFSDITVAETQIFNEGFFDADREALMIRVRAATRQEKIAYMKAERGSL